MQANTKTEVIENGADNAEVVIDEHTNFGTLICRTWDGRGLWLKPEEDVETSAVLNAQQRSIRGTKADIKLLTELMANALCTIDGEPITPSHLNGIPKKNPSVIGWKAYDKLQKAVTETNKELPSLGNSSE